MHTLRLRSNTSRDVAHLLLGTCANPVTQRPTAATSLPRASCSRAVGDPERLSRPGRRNWKHLWPQGQGQHAGLAQR